jgi:2-(1,2-epoxy-1,2-dihydrophenyl)acetyl-CoA isomerase
MTAPIPAGNATLRIEVFDRVGVITFTRPESRNALHDDMFDSMRAAIDAFAESPDVGCVVITGEGAAFCAGGDVREGMGRRRPDGSKPTREERVANLVANSQVCVQLHEAPIVTIAAVNGAAVGAGMAIALACDLRIAAASARFIGGWARLGFSGDFGGPWLLANRVGPAKALELLATNSTVAADEALQLGMVDRLVGDDEFERAWRAWAKQFASGPQTAIGYIKQNVLNASRLTLAEAIPIEAELQTRTTATEDHREAVRAWLAKRDPVFGQPGGV